jgi:two-component system NtrC family sensor kinase
MGRKRGYRSLIIVPLLRDRDPIGLINVTRREIGRFAAHHVNLLRTFADQAVIAIENVRLFNETKEALERQTATADILKVIASSPSDVQPVFEAIATSANKLIGGFSTAVLRFIGDELRLAAFTPTNPEADAALQAAFPGAISHFPQFMLVHDGQTTQFTDTEAEGVPPANRDLARLRGYRSMSFTPLMSNGAPIGLISVTRKETGSFADHHVQLVRTFADQAVIAIENVRLFDEVQAKTRDLSQSLDDLRTAQDRLVHTEKLASLGQLTAGIAHEIKNPLNFVNNFSALSAELIDELDETLAPAPLDQKMRGDVGELTQLLKSNLEKVVQHGKRADSIVKNMLLHSREGSGEHRPADINVLIEESLNLAYHGARAEKAGFEITMQRNFDSAAGIADVYPQEITRALLNLISNGFYAATRRATEAGDDFKPMLSAATRNLGDKIEIRIRDNGTGIPDEIKEKIFNPFFTTKPSGEGTGLGLSMSHDIIVKLHGGIIDVETEPGRFTEFKIVLPRTSQR